MPAVPPLAAPKRWPRVFRKDGCYVRPNHRKRCVKFRSQTASLGF